MAALRRTKLSYDDLTGWAADDHAAALGVYLLTAAPALAGRAAALAPRAFFETCFEPVLIEDGTPMLFTGYYEPELPAARQRTDRFTCPIYARPADLDRDPGQPWLSRAEIEAGALTGQGLELAWLEDAVAAFFLQVQGSGRLMMADGAVLRVNFAGRNGRPYTSVGRLLIEAGHLSQDGADAQTVKSWLRAHPGPARQIMQRNESFVFFRALTGLAAHSGPIGSMGAPVTALRSIAVDPAAVPLGSAVWIEAATAPPMHRLMVAQDTGSAILGAQRADIFFGTGTDAGRAAGKIRAPGRMIVLAPRADLLVPSAGAA